MATAVRRLLGRLSSLMNINVAVVADTLIWNADVLRLIDTRQLSEAIELVRVV